MNRHRKGDFTEEHEPLAAHGDVDHMLRNHGHLAVIGEIQVYDRAKMRMQGFELKTGITGQRDKPVTEMEFRDFIDDVTQIFKDNLTRCILEDVNDYDPSYLNVKVYDPDVPIQ